MSPDPFNAAQVWYAVTATNHGNFPLVHFVHSPKNSSVIFASMSPPVSLAYPGSLLALRSLRDCYSGDGAARRRWWIEEGGGRESYERTRGHLCRRSTGLARTYSSFSSRRGRLPGRPAQKTVLSLRLRDDNFSGLFPRTPFCKYPFVKFR